MPAAAGPTAVDDTFNVRPGIAVVDVNVLRNDNLGPSSTAATAQLAGPATQTIPVTTANPATTTALDLTLSPAGDVQFVAGPIGSVVTFRYNILHNGDVASTASVTITVTATATATGGSRMAGSVLGHLCTRPGAAQGRSSAAAGPWTLLRNRPLHAEAPQPASAWRRMAAAQHCTAPCTPGPAPHGHQLLSHCRARPLHASAWAICG
jgi:hypothetical protein